MPHRSYCAAAESAKAAAVESTKTTATESTHAAAAKPAAAKAAVKSAAAAKATAATMPAAPALSEGRWRSSKQEHCTACSYEHSCFHRSSPTETRASTSPTHRSINRRDLVQLTDHGFLLSVVRR